MGSPATGRTARSVAAALAGQAGLPDYRATTLSLLCGAPTGADSLCPRKYSDPFDLARNSDLAAADGSTQHRRSANSSSHRFYRSNSIVATRSPRDRARPSSTMPRVVIPLSNLPFQDP